MIFNDENNLKIMTRTLKKKQRALNFHTERPISCLSLRSRDTFFFAY